MIKITNIDGTPLLLEDSRIKVIQRAVGATVTEITMLKGKRFTTQDDIASIYASNCPTLLIRVTSSLDDGTEFLYPTLTIESIEPAPGGGSRILFHAERTPSLVTQSVNDIETQLCQANSGGGGGDDGNRKGAVLSIVDNTSTAPGSPVLGDRYILDNTGATDPSWGGAAPNSIVEWDGSQWVATAPLEGWTAYVDSVNEDAIYEDDGVPGWKLKGRAPIELSNTIVVATNGDDATALPNRWDRPYANPTTGIAAAAALGFQVIIFPGTYEIGPGGLADTGNLRLIKNGVSVFCWAGVTINHTVLGGSELWSDDDLPTTAQWTGELTFNGRVSGGAYLMGSNINTSIRLEGELWTGERFQHSAFDTFVFDFDEQITDKQFFAINPAVNLVGATFVYKVRKAFQTGVPFVTSFAFNPTGGLFEGSSLTMEIENYRYGYSFLFGNIYIGDILDETTTLDIDIKSCLQTGTDDLFGLPLIYLANQDTANLNISIRNILRYGRLLDMPFGVNYGVRGKIHFQGVIQPFAIGGRAMSDIRASQGSLTIDYDIVARGHLTPNGSFIRATGASNATRITGEVLWEAPNDTQHCIVVEDNGGVTTHASIDNFKVEITNNLSADIIGDFVLSPVNPINIPIYEVSTNRLTPVVSLYTQEITNIRRNQYVKVL